jgi:hypothetical protein
MANGCLVVTERSTQYEPVLLFQHFVQAPDAVGVRHRAAADEALRRRMTGEAYASAKNELAHEVPPRSHARAGSFPEPPPAPWRPRPSPNGRRFRRRGLVAAGGRRKRRHAGRTPPGRPCSSTRAQGKPPDSPALFRRCSNQQAVKRRVEALQSSYGDAEAYELAKTPADDTPDLSVVIWSTTRTCPSAWRACFGSVGVRPGSDRRRPFRRSVTVSHPWYSAAHPLLPMAGILSRHRGQSAARNRVRPRGEAVADADNLIYPDTLRKLKAALRQRRRLRGGMVAQFGTSGLFSWLPWDVEELLKRNSSTQRPDRPRRAVVGVFGRNWWSCLGTGDYRVALRVWRLAGPSVPEILALYGPTAIRSFHRQPRDVRDPGLLQRQYPALPWPEPLRRRRSMTDRQPDPDPRLEVIRLEQEVRRCATGWR